MRCSTCRGRSSGTAPPPGLQQPPLLRQEKKQFVARQSISVVVVTVNAPQKTRPRTVSVSRQFIPSWSPSPSASARAAHRTTEGSQGRCIDTRRLLLLCHANKPHGIFGGHRTENSPPPDYRDSGEFIYGELSESSGPVPVIVKVMRDHLCIRTGN
jgi:hypothetical protein